MTNARFAKLASEALASLPEAIRNKLSNVALFIGRRAGEKERARHGLGEDEELFGLYEGTPQTERGEGYFGVLPDRIVLYKEAIEEACETEEEVREEIRRTVWHEVAHHFGMDDSALHGIEEMRGWR